MIPLDSVSESVRDNLLKDENLSLKPNELDKLRGLLERNPTLVELHIFNTMWSEHCSYKSSRPVLQKYLPTKAPHVLLGPGEDAGIIRFYEKDGRHYCLVLAHESHNHPSQVLPVEGAATGIGGIVRDVYCMGADVIGVMDPLRFGDPDGPKGARVRDIAWGVVDGIARYGNPLGVPNLGGDVFFDSSYDDNCLVNVVAFGVVEETDIIRSRAPEGAGKTPHDVILIGKPTDASGFGGATFASERLSEDETVEQQGAVQVPDPFLKRVLAEATKAVLDLAKRKKIALGFKDLGAGGISCAISEMAQAGGVGITIDLDQVNVALPDLPAQVVACSETQERYAFVVPAGFTADVLRIYNEDFELPGLYRGAGAFLIGRVTNDRRFKISSAGRLVCDADVDAITTGIVYEREKKKRVRARQLPGRRVAGLEDTLLSLLSAYNISDKSKVFKHYDTEVQGRAVLRAGEADAAVCLLLPGDPVAVATACGGNSRLAALDPYLGGVWAVIEAARNVVCVGARPLAVTDCLNYGDPEDPGVFWEFSEGVRGISDACRGLIIDPADSGSLLPVVSGNASFYNQSETGEPIAPTPIVACAGRVDDASVCRDIGFKKDDSKLVLLGKLHTCMGGSEYETLFGGPDDSPPPKPDLDQENAIQHAVIEGIRSNAILAAHDISHGGLLVT